MAYREGNVVKVASLPDEASDIGVDDAMEEVLGQTGLVDTVNEDAGGNAVYRVLGWWFYEDNLKRGLKKDIPSFKFEQGERVRVIGLPTDDDPMGAIHHDIVGQVFPVVDRYITHGQQAYGLSDTMWTYYVLEEHIETE